MAEQLTFQWEEGGSIPTSPLQFSNAETSLSWQKIIRDKKTLELGSLPPPNVSLNLSEAHIKRITYRDALPIIKEYKWLGTMPTFSTHYFGLFFNDICGGVVVYGISLPKIVLDSVAGEEYGRHVRVLSRGACVHWTPINSASKLIGGSLKELSREGYKIVLAYCDTRANEIGTIYQACNFLYTGTSSGRLEYYIEGKWRTGKGATHYAHKRRDLSQYPTRPRATKHRYVYLLGNKQEHKELLTKLHYPILPYPKRLEDKK